MKGIEGILFSYRVEYKEGKDILVFNCMAEDHEHAKEQCLNAYPGAKALFTYQGEKAA
jgi:hypothetical protein